MGILEYLDRELTEFRFFFPRAKDRILPTERKILRVRDHWAVVVVVLLQTVGIVLGLGLLSYLIRGFWLLDSVIFYTQVAALVRLVWKLMQWWDDMMVVTDQRFMRTYGVLTARTDMMPVKKLTDMSVGRTTLGWIVGYGWIRIESAGHDSLQYFRFVSRPEEVFRVIEALTFSEGLPKPKRSGARRRRSDKVEALVQQAD